MDSSNPVLSDYSNPTQFTEQLNQLLWQPTSFIGREQEIAEIKEKN